MAKLVILGLRESKWYYLLLPCPPCLIKVLPNWILLGPGWLGQNGITYYFHAMLDQKHAEFDIFGADWFKKLKLEPNNTHQRITLRSKLLRTNKLTLFTAQHGQKPHQLFWPDVCSAVSPCQLALPPLEVCPGGRVRSLGFAGAERSRRTGQRKDVLELNPASIKRCTFSTSGTSSSWLQHILQKR